MLAYVGSEKSNARFSYKMSGAITLMKWIGFLKNSVFAIKQKQIGFLKNHVFCILSSNICWQAANCKKCDNYREIFPDYKIQVLVLFLCSRAPFICLSPHMACTQCCYLIVMACICLFVSCQSPPAFIWMSCKKHQIVVGMATRLVFCNHHHSFHQEQPSKIISQYHCHYICGG